MINQDQYDKAPLTDITFLGVQFNGLPVMGISAAAFDASWPSKVQWETFRHNLRFIVSKCVIGNSGIYPQGVFGPDPRLGNVVLLLVMNQSGGVTLILESESNALSVCFPAYSDLLERYQLSADAESVIDVIEKNSFLNPLLEEIPGQIEKYFGAGQRMTLRVSFEPDNWQPEDLWIDILTALPAEEAYALLERFDQNWWLDNIERAKAKLNITLKYI